MATLRIDNRGTLHLAGADKVPADPCMEFGAALWLLCVSPHTSLKLQALATRLLQIHPFLQVAILQCSAGISSALTYVLSPLSSVIKDLVINNSTSSSLENEPNDDGLILAIQDQLTLIEKDSRCHNPVWIEQATQNALQPYVHLAKLFHQLLMRSRSLQPASNGEDEPPFTSVTKAPPNGHSPVSLNKSLITIAEPKEECRTPLGAHTFGAEPSQPSVISKQPTEQLVSTELSADQIFQALVRRGCQDLTTVIDTGSFSVGVVAGGNFGDIWRGKLNDGTDVAVKVWRISWLSTENHKILKRLTREIYNWSKTNHANVHQLLGVMMFQGRVGMVSRWMPNGNLQEYLSKHKTADRYQLCAQVSKGVQYLHAKSIIHGDLKATNILVSCDGVAMLTDFDHSIVSNCSLVFSATTQNGGGTLRWMAPELLIDENSRRSKETDMYALGMTIWEIITGTIPYPQCRNDAQVINKVTKKIMLERNTTHFAKDQTGDRIWVFLKKCWDHRPILRPTATKAVELFHALCPKRTTSLMLGNQINAPLPPRKTSTLSKFRLHALLPPIQEEVEQSSPRKLTIASASAEPKIINRGTSSPPGQRHQVNERNVTTSICRAKPVTLPKPTNATRGFSRGLTASGNLKPSVKKQPSEEKPTNSTGAGAVLGPSSGPVPLLKPPVQPAAATKTRIATKRPVVLAPKLLVGSVTKPARGQTMISTHASPVSVDVRAMSNNTTVAPKQQNAAGKLRYSSVSSASSRVTVKRRGTTVSNADKVHGTITSSPSITPED